MPRYVKVVSHGNVDQKKVQRDVQNAMKAVQDAKRIIAEQRRLGNLPPARSKASPGSVSSQRPTTHNQFNVIGGTINNAVIGGKEPVTKNEETRVYSGDANRFRCLITGGKFSQANFGGQVEYRNTGCAIGGGLQSATDVRYEDLLLYILEKGVTVTQLTMLLEREYSLANIAFCLPKNNFGVGRVVGVLLSDE